MLCESTLYIYMRKHVVIWAVVILTGMLAALHLCEQMIEGVAAGAGIPSVELREANFYTDGQAGPYFDVVSPCLMQDLWQKAKTSSDYEKRAAEIELFNKVLFIIYYTVLTLSW